MKRRAARLVALAAASVVAACSGPRDRAPAAEVTDSAGVRILTYELTDQVVPIHRVVAEHDVEIGVLDGAREYTFSRITDLAVTDDGSILVSDAQARDLRLYDAGGTFVRTIGRPGEGPGEFGSAPTVAGLSGDTVVTYDVRNRRLTLFGATGELIGETSLRSDAIGQSQAAQR